jgi:hypothetical protein
VHVERTRSTLQRDELLTQNKILEKQASPLAKKANQYSEAEPYETKHGVDLQQNGDEMAPCYVIDFTVGWSFGEPYG